MAAATILVVDDERNILTSVSRALGLEGYEVEVAGSAEIALDKLAKQTFDAVLLDVQLPGIDGLAMLDELRTMDWVPRLVRSKASKLGEAVKRLETKLGRSPNEIELAAQLEITVPELEKMMTDANASNLVSLNKKWYETDSYKDVREIDILEDKKGLDPTRRIQKNDLMRLVTKGLNRNERLIIILYYYEELTMKEIGATLDLSESRVSQMHSAIVQRLQTQLGRRRPEFAG